MKNVFENGQYDIKTIQNTVDSTGNFEINSMSLTQLLDVATNPANPESVEAVRVLADAGIRADAYNTLSPQVKQYVLDHIQATGQYNKDIAEIMQAGGKATQQIESAAVGLKLANKELINSRQYNAQDYTLRSTILDDTHQFKMEYSTASAAISTLMNRANQAYQINGLYLRPQIAQLINDRKVAMQRLQHSLQHGSEGDPEKLVASADYGEYGREYKQGNVDNKDGKGVFASLQGFASKFLEGVLGI